MKFKICAVSVGLFLVISSQSFAQQCPGNKFVNANGGYSTTAGYYVELGTWPNTDEPWGFNFGVAADNIHSSGKNPDQAIEATMYARVQYRMHRFVQPTISIGATDFYRLYLSAGMRISVPIGNGKKAAIILEPHYGTRGAGIAGGVGIALN